MTILSPQHKVRVKAWLKKLYESAQYDAQQGPRALAEVHASASVSTDRFILLFFTD